MRSDGAEWSPEAAHGLAFPVGLNIHVPHDAAILFLEKRKLTFPQKYVH